MLIEGSAFKRLCRLCLCLKRGRPPDLLMLPIRPGLVPTRSSPLLYAAACRSSSATRLFFSSYSTMSSPSYSHRSGTPQSQRSPSQSAGLGSTTMGTRLISTACVFFFFFPNSQRGVAVTPKSYPTDSSIQCR